MFGILWAIATILVIYWIIAFFFHILAFTAGAGIHAILVVAVILFVVGFLTRGRTAA